MEKTVSAILSARVVVDEYLNQQEVIPHIIPIIPAHTAQGGHIGLPCGVVETVSQSTKHKIEIYRVGPLNGLLGYALQYNLPDGGKKTRIAYSSGLNVCWSRLIIAKEAMHILLGTSANRTVTADDAKDLITSLFNDAIPKTAACTVEHTAIYGAIEMLFPHEHHKDIREMMSYGSSTYDIAKSYRIPEYLLEIRLQEGLNDAYNQAYKELGLEPIL